MIVRMGSSVYPQLGSFAGTSIPQSCLHCNMQCERRDATARSVQRAAGRHLFHAPGAEEHLADLDSLASHLEATHKRKMLR